MRRDAIDVALAALFITAALVMLAYTIYVVTLEAEAIEELWRLW